MRKRIRASVMLLVMAGVCAAGCGQTRQASKTTEKKETAVEEAKPEEKKEFTFRDVEGNSYTVPLSENAVKNTYDYTKLTEQGGFKYYEDKEKNIVSRVGVDVSKYQTDVDWNKMKESGISFAVIRVGYRTYGESGEVRLDEQFLKHIVGASQAGLDVGVYFFSQAVSEEEAREEAVFVTEQIKPYHVSLPVVYDTEEIKNDTARTDGLTKEQYTKNCIAFCEKVKEAGYEPMIYSNMKWLSYMLDIEKLEQYSFWYADYEAIPQNPYRFQMWQYTETGEIPGVSGTYDLNIMFAPGNST